MYKLCTIYWVIHYVRYTRYDNCIEVKKSKSKLSNQDLLCVILATCVYVGRCRSNYLDFQMVHVVPTRIVFVETQSNIVK